MKPVEMKHANSKMTITVAPGQVKNANYYGWVEVEPVKVESKVKEKQNGKNTRK
jgi:hypothetical protein